MLWFYLPGSYDIEQYEKNSIICIKIKSENKQIIRRYSKNRFFNKSLDVWSLAQKEAQYIINNINNNDIQKIDGSL